MSESQINILLYNAQSFLARELLSLLVYRIETDQSKERLLILIIRILAEVLNAEGFH